MRHAPRCRKSRMVHPAVSRLPDGQLRDPSVVVEGLGSLSLLQDVSGSPVCEVPLRAGVAMPSSSELWVASLSSVDDEMMRCWLLPKVLLPARYSTPLMCAMIRRC
jgi:hypothetical protein